MNASSFLADARGPADTADARQRSHDLVVLHLNQLVAALLLMLLSPLMAVVAFLIWRRDGAPVLFAHYRVGHDGKLFRCLKFRSMLRNSSASVVNSPCVWLE